MVGSRTLTALVGLVGSFVASVVLWWYFNTILFFLFIPFVPFLFKGIGGGESETRAQRVRTCPECDFQSANDEFEYCPRDGRRLRQDYWPE